MNTGKRSPVTALLWLIIASTWYSKIKVLWLMLYSCIVVHVQCTRAGYGWRWDVRFQDVSEYDAIGRQSPGQVDRSAETRKEKCAHAESWWHAVIAPDEIWKTRTRTDCGLGKSDSTRDATDSLHLIRTLRTASIGVWLSSLPIRWLTKMRSRTCSGWVMGCFRNSTVGHVFEIRSLRILGVRDAAMVTESVVNVKQLWSRNICWCERYITICQRGVIDSTKCDRSDAKIMLLALRVVEKMINTVYSTYSLRSRV
jgi:hypothetical protein